MLHLRVIAPSSKADAVRKIIDGCPGATHVVIHPGAAVEPAGDVIHADVARESTEELLCALRELGIPDQGAITLEQLDTTISRLADEAEERAPGEGADAVVWEELTARSGEESALTSTFLCFLTIACLLAAVGVITDSAVTIVGAMVVGPEFGPLAAVAVGLVARRGDLAKQGALALAVGFPVAMAVTAAGTALGRWAGLFTDHALDHLAQVDFVYKVGPFSLIVALLAGAAGMLALTSSRSAVLVGVFISVTTVPAAGMTVVAALLGQWNQAAGAFGQLVVNLAGIIAAAALTLLLRRSAAPTA
ncbi:DUF389 domain-containing protein [Pseudonocardiaceae bacterium YIM PH 21723]|nr:DUF389 domain-containing protein [Pseudonocardiaceae bacterium YIM PH 21723]